MIISPNPSIVCQTDRNRGGSAQNLTFGAHPFGIMTTTGLLRGFLWAARRETMTEHVEQRQEAAQS